MANYVLLFSLFSFFIIFFKREKITKKLGIIDKPDKKRKFHKIETSTIAGILLGAILIPFFLIFKDLYKVNNSLIFLSILYVIALGVSGIFDDIKNINANKKFFIFITSTFILVLLNEILVVEKIYFEYFDKDIYLFGTSIIFTVFCVLLLINSLNLIDGKNGIFLSYIAFLFIIFFYQNNVYFNLYIILIFVLIFFNVKGEFFSGNAGTNIGSTFFAIITLYYYNTKQIMPISGDILTAEIIFLIFIIPGIDMLRVFLERFVKNKHPFAPDNNHLHHLMCNVINEKIVFIPYTLLFSSPYIVSLLINMENLYIITISILVYSLILMYLRKIKN